MEKIYRVQMNSKGMPNFSTAVEITDRPQGEWIDNGWHGDWQFETDGRGNCWKAFICSNCNTTSKAQTNFCPNCGARMKGADDEV